MSSVADELRREHRLAVVGLTPDERLRLAWALGESGLATFMAAQGLPRAEAVRRLELVKQRSRRRSASLLSLLE
jgi:hypothetical protein